MTIWNADQYLKFADHRARPGLELLARIPIDAPSSVWDLGCGAGNLTAALRERWSRARIVGLDNSPEMLAKARKIAGIEWIECDLVGWSAPEPADVVFSNAVLHWVPDHARLFAHLMRQVAPGGALAVQMPRNFAARSHTALYETAREPAWAAALAPLLGPTPVAAPAQYYEWLKPHAAAVDVWETEYLQVLTGDDAVVEWTRATAVKPFLDALPSAQREPFLAAYRARLAPAYPRRDDGTTLFAFRRLFIVALAPAR
ncbi:MAG: methyltransferase domain-containing protein [Alphaproteobacteria bacterium]|nr:methyltransferase domain-containing protein [Alphaproteobacteria bacterium]